MSGTRERIGFIGLGTMGAGIVEVIARGIVTGTFADRRKRRMIDSLHDHTIICGYGRVGRQVAAEFRAHGRKATDDAIEHLIALVDPKDRAFSKDIQLGIRNNRGQLDDPVVVRTQSRHFHVEPDEVVLILGHERMRGYGRAAGKSTRR